MKENQKCVVVLPTWGSPYIFDLLDGKNDLKVLQSAVQGEITGFDRRCFVLHPMFANKGRWLLARQILTANCVKVYVNNEGANDCSPNMATVITNYNKRINGCPHLFGDVAVIVPYRVLKTFDIDLDVLTLHRPPIEYDEDDDEDDKYDKRQNNGCWDFENEEDEENFIKEVKEKEYDYKRSTGFCYLKKCVGDVDDE